MRDFLSWNLNLGRWGGVQIRLHVLLLVLAAGVAQAAWNEQLGVPGWYAGALLGMLLASVLLHEMGHCLAAHRLGGGCDQIILWPLGGLTPPSAPHEPRAELLVALAGPLMNLLVAVATLPALVMLRWNLWDLFNPLSIPSQPPAAFAQQAGPLCLAWLFWLNWLLALFNLLPAHPLDGGRMVRATLAMGFGQRSAMLGAARIAQLTAIWLWIVAWLLPPDVARYATLPLILLGVLLFFEGRHEWSRRDEPPRDEATFGYDFSQGYTSLERTLEIPAKTDSGPVRKWLDERREARQQRQRQIEADEERRVDEILMRLHQLGLEGLSLEDKAVLDRVSARYRNRQQQ